MKIERATLFESTSAIFSGTKLMVCVNQIKKHFGLPSILYWDGNKHRIEWNLKIDDIHIVNIYDFHRYGNLADDEVIEFSIESYSGHPETIYKAADGYYESANTDNIEQVVKKLLEAI